MKSIFFVNKFYFCVPADKEVSEIAKFKIEKLNKEIDKIIPILRNPNVFGVFVSQRAFIKYAKLAEEYLELSNNEAW